MSTIPTKADYEEGKTRKAAAQALAKEARVAAEVVEYAKVVGEAIRSGNPTVMIHKQFITEAAEKRLKLLFVAHGWRLTITNCFAGCNIAWDYTGNARSCN